MEENTMAMQALVIAHAAYGHNSFFKGNYLFRTWTDASSIIDYLVYAKAYVTECEERHGIDRVEELLDSCHALMSHGVDRYKRPRKLSLSEERHRRADREAYLQSQVNELWRTLPIRANESHSDTRERFPREPQENLLYFIEKSAPLLEPWEREIVRIVRKVGQYLYPQRQTQVMNEGWATFWHHTLLNTMYDQGMLHDSLMLEVLHSHSSVILQSPPDKPWYRGINPYALGLAIFQDLRRMCERPTDEDRRWFPEIAGSDWIKTLDFAMRNFKDESFIAQFLSPKVMRDFRFFSLLDDDSQPVYRITAIHDDDGYMMLREKLARQYDISLVDPNIQVWDVDMRGDRALTLRHFQHDRRPLGEETEEVLKHVGRLWKFAVHLDSVAPDGSITKTWKWRP